MWSESNCRKTAALVLLCGLVVMLSGCGGILTSQDPKPSAGDSAAMPGQGRAENAPQTQAAQGQATTIQTPESSISEVDLQSLEVLRALRDSWSVKGSKVVMSSKREGVR